MLPEIPRIHRHNHVYFNMSLHLRMTVANIN